MIKGLIHPRGLMHEHGLFKPFLPPPSGPALLADLDFSVPVTASDFSSANATEEWPISTPTAGVYANSKGGTGLANNGGNGLEDQDAPGIYDGVSYVGKAWEVRPGAGSGTDYLHTSGDTSTLDSNNEDLCVLIIFRSVGPSGTSHIITKRGVGAVGGWSIRWGGGGTLIVDIDDGAVSFPDAVVGDHQDGAWHYAKFWWDESEKELSVKTDLYEELAQATALTTDISNAQELAIGRWVLGDSAPMPNTQVLHVGGAVGVTAEALFNETVILPGEDPANENTTLAPLTTIDRASLLSRQISATRVCHFGNDRLPIGFNATLTAGMALRANSAQENLVPYSELSTGATSSNVTPTDNAADAPDGFRSATTILATAANGYLEKVCVTTAGLQYTGAAFIEESTVGVTGRVVAYDLTNGAEIDATVFVGTDEPVDVPITFTTPALCVSVGLRVEVDTDTETVIAWGWQLNRGDARGSIVRTNGAAASLVSGVYKAAAPASIAALGEIKVTSVWEAFGSHALCFLYDVHSATGNENRRRFYMDSATRWRTSLYTDAGVSEGDVISSTAVRTEVVSRHIWDASAAGDDTGGLEQLCIYDGTQRDGETSPWTGTATGGADIDTIIIGGALGGAGSEFDGDIQRIQIYDGLSEALP